ncbi:MAG: L-threonylcarbamoyladenylate synthase [Salibacteraceae bacterium]
MTEHDVIQKCVEILAGGGVILCPADTIASLSCDATNAKAVERIFEIKNRPAEKSVIVLVDSIEMLRRYTHEFPPLALEHLSNSTKPLTMILPGSKKLASNIGALDKSVGFRIPSKGFIHTLVRTFRKPIVSTSANFSGMPAPVAVSDADEKIKSTVDYLVDLPPQGDTPSTIIKYFSDNTHEIIRP